MGELSKEQKLILKNIYDERESLLSPYATRSCSAIREKTARTVEDTLRNPFSVDIDKILHNVVYNRYVDKTQVFSFYKNDDITRRALHVQLVARIGQIIGSALNLNLDLINAIALGHDIGHTPFGHKGEEFLNEIYYNRTQRYFNHNVHSVRVLKIMTKSNLTLQVYDGILCHCGEKTFDKYTPDESRSFREFNEIFEKCYIEKDSIGKLKPCTLEGCVVRISDIIAYIGKDRQDAYKAGLCKSMEYETNISNKELINNLILNIVENSLNKGYLQIDRITHEFLNKVKDENNELIYQNDKITAPYYEIIRPMMGRIYEKMIDDFTKHNFQSPIYKHYLNHPILGNYCRKSVSNRKIIISADEVVVDYIASMTDDYFIDLYVKLFGKDKFSKAIKYVPYFEN